MKKAVHITREAAFKSLASLPVYQFIEHFAKG
ncbi:MAG: hypothetical protein N838_27495 [Thiohalocapsa sp. PB-PSB1]|nr:MAG: hypothetical protein N838_27495 [Thiohalocapsa sp. PB-PSB1]